MDFTTEQLRRFGFRFPWLEGAERISPFESPSLMPVRVGVRLEEDVTQSLEKHATS